MQEQPSVARTALKYGIIVAVGVIIYSTVLTIADLTQNQALSSLAFVILIAGMVWAMRDFRTRNDGFMSYGQGLGIGSLMSAIVGLLGSVFSMFYMTFIDTNLIKKSMDATREKLEKQGMDDAQIDQAIQMTEKFMTPGMMFVIGVLTYVVIGFIASLIVSAIMRRNRPVFE